MYSIWGGTKHGGVGFDLYFTNQLWSRVYFYLVGAVMSASRILTFDVAANWLTLTIHGFCGDIFTFGACLYLLASCAHKPALRYSCFSVGTRQHCLAPKHGVVLLEFLLNCQTWRPISSCTATLTTKSIPSISLKDFDYKSDFHHKCLSV